MPQPIRVGIMTIQNAPYTTLLDRWQVLDSLGFDSVWVADHVTNPWQPHEAWLDGWTTLAALATHTTRIRIGPLVTNMALHNPTMLARQALTLDQITGGRLALGLGAGGAPVDHRMTGISNWPPAERVTRFQEYVALLDQLLRRDAVTSDGAYYPVEQAQLLPKSQQQPRAPLTIAAIGHRSLQIAARYADAWSWFPPYDATPDEALRITKERNTRLDELCVSLGRDPHRVVRSLLVIPRIADTPFDSDDALYDFIGRYREAGMNEFIFYWWREDLIRLGYDNGLIARSADRALIEKLASEVIPTIRTDV